MTVQYSFWCPGCHKLSILTEKVGEHFDFTNPNLVCDFCQVRGYVATDWIRRQAKPHPAWLGWLGAVAFIVAILCVVFVVFYFAYPCTILTDYFGAC